MHAHARQPAAQVGLDERADAGEPRDAGVRGDLEARGRPGDRVVPGGPGALDEELREGGDIAEREGRA